MASKHGLGRGLSALIRDTPVERTPVATTPEYPQVEIARIRPNPWQPRRIFTREALDELAASIREHGVLEPLIVRKVEDGYELIAGERRWRAAQESGLTQVPVRVIEADDQKALELALVENLQRADLNVIEEAEGYQVLADKFGLTQDEISKRVNKARASVANALRLLGLPKEIKQFISEGLLSSGHAKVLMGSGTEAQQCKLAERTIKDGLSVRDLERIVEQARSVPRKRRESKSDMPSDHLTDLTNRLHQHFGTSVHIQPCRTLPNGRKIKGSVQIDYYSNDELSRVLELLGLSEQA
jgi:ParB family chromosome partitioning protein